MVFFSKLLPCKNWITNISYKTNFINPDFLIALTIIHKTNVGNYIWFITVRFVFQNKKLKSRLNCFITYLHMFLMHCLLIGDSNEHVKNTFFMLLFFEKFADKTFFKVYFKETIVIVCY